MHIDCMLTVVVAMGSTLSLSENKITIYLAWPQIVWLRAYATRKGIGFSETVRRAVDEFIDGHE